MTRRLAQVAQKVGASEATVSRVLNGKPGVSDATRKAVLSALDVPGYEFPTQLRGEWARLVGLVLPELQNPIFPDAEVVGGALARPLRPRALAAQACRRPSARPGGGHHRA
jgi:DNA-binding LacI/PurR family transcriptional regulator